MPNLNPKGSEGFCFVCCFHCWDELDYVSMCRLTGCHFVLFVTELQLCEADSTISIWLIILILNHSNYYSSDIFCTLSYDRTTNCSSKGIDLRYCSRSLLSQVHNVTGLH